MVETGIVRGWDDPRMPTIRGLRRRGYTAGILNSFCEANGATRAENTIELAKLEYQVVAVLVVTHKLSPTQ